MKVLVAYDGSKPSKKALDSAAEFAAKYGAYLVLVSVTESVCPIGISQEECATMNDILERETEKLVESIKQDLQKKALKVKTLFRKGSPADEIVKLAEKEGADVIVIGSHGRHGAKKFFLGSVSSRVATHAPCSVLLVK